MTDILHYRKRDLKFDSIVSKENGIRNWNKMKKGIFYRFRLGTLRGYFLLEIAAKHSLHTKLEILGYF